MNMSNRPTPETDSEHLQFAMGGFTLDFCRKLERERDEAREKLCKVLKVLDDYDQAIKNPSSPFWEAFKKWFTWEAGK